jgi:hypothetical protein
MSVVMRDHFSVLMRSEASAALDRDDQRADRLGDLY